MSNKIGNNIEMKLVNSHGIGEFITNIFKDKTCLQIALYNCPKNARNVRNVLNNHNKYNYKWNIQYESDSLMIFQTKDFSGNLKYFHLKFEKEE